MRCDHIIHKHISHLFFDKVMLFSLSLTLVMTTLALCVKKDFFSIPFFHNIPLFLPRWLVKYTLILYHTDSTWHTSILYFEYEGGSILLVSSPIFNADLICMVACYQIWNSCNFRQSRHSSHHLFIQYKHKYSCHQLTKCDKSNEYQQHNIMYST